MSISTTDQTVNQCAAAISQLSLSIFQLVEALLHRIQNEVDEDRDVLSFQICVLLTSLLDVHAAQQRKHQSLSWIEKAKHELFSSSEMRGMISHIETLLQQTDLPSKKECVERLDEIKYFYHRDNPIHDESELFSLDKRVAVSEQIPTVSLQHVEENTSKPTYTPASPPLMFTQRESKRIKNRRS
jgi:hypothetical protein